MKIQNIHLMYEYNYWASGKILAAAAKVTQEQLTAPAAFPYGSLRETLLHIVDGEYGWRGLFEQNTFLELNWDDFTTFASIEKKFHEEEKALRAYLNRLTDADMESHLRYTIEGGIQRDRILWHCLYHLVNHGTQHRSEAAAILTSYGASPGDIDFTLFLNEMAKAK
jgi:uncharacterized damage-inducible protein DinB